MALALAFALAPALASRFLPLASQLAVTTASIHVEFAASRLEFKARECRHRIQLEKLCLETYFQLWRRVLKRETHRFDVEPGAARRGVADPLRKCESQAGAVKAKNLKPYLLREDGRENREKLQKQGGGSISRLSAR